MNKRITITDMYIEAILIILFIAVYFYSLISYTIRIPMLLIAISMVLFIPILTRTAKVSISFCRLMWTVVICIALIGMDRCIANDIQGKLYFIFVLLFIIICKGWVTRPLELSEKIIYIMGGFFSAFTLFEVFFNSLYIRAIAPLLRVNGLWNVINDSQLRRYAGFTSQPSINAVYICFGLGASFVSFLFTESKKNKIKITILIIVEFICILLTAKRGPLIYALLSMLLIYFYNSNRGRKITNAVKIIFSLVAVYFVVYFIMPSVNSFFTVYFEGSSKVGDISNGRYALYESAWQYFLNNKWVGIGWTNFRYSYFRYIDVHNIYLQLLCETGLIGAIPFFFAFIYTYFSSVKKMNQLKKNGGASYRLMLFSLFLQTFFLLHGMTSNALYDYYISFFYFLAVIISETVLSNGMDINNAVLITRYPEYGEPNDISSK